MTDPKIEEMHQELHDWINISHSTRNGGDAACLCPYVEIGKTPIQFHCKFCKESSWNTSEKR